MLEDLQIAKDDRERVLELCVELVLHSERVARAEHGAQILETILGLRFQDDGLGPVGDDRARDRLASILTTAAEAARRPVAATGSGKATVGVW